MGLTDDIRKKAEDEFDLSYKDELELWLAWGVVKRKVVPVVKTWLLRFWNDPAYFTGSVRFLIVGLSGAILSGQVVLPWPKVTWFLAVFLPAIAVGIPAGQTNRSEGQIKAIAEDPTIPAAPKAE